MGLTLFSKKPSSESRPVTEEEKKVLLELQELLNKELAGNVYNFGNSDYSQYCNEVSDYVEKNSVYQITEMTVSDDRVLHLSLEPKPKRAVIDIIVEDKETEE